MSDAASNLRDDPAAEALLRASIERAVAARAQIDDRHSALEAGLEVLREGPDAARRIAQAYQKWILEGHVIIERLVGAVLATPASIEEFSAITGVPVDTITEFLGDNDEGRRYTDALLMQADS